MLGALAAIELLNIFCEITGTGVSSSKEKKMVQRDLKKEVLLNRDSPARDIVGMDNFAKKRALERRERAASSSSTRNV